MSRKRKKEYDRERETDKGNREGYLEFLKEADGTFNPDGSN